MSNDISQDEEIRGHILRTLSYDKEGTLSDVAVRSALRGLRYDRTIDQVRQFFDYLAGE